MQLPLLAPALTSIFLLKLILGFKAFDLVYVLAAGDPGSETSISSYQIWRTLFQDYDVGLASAETLLLSAVVSLASLPLTWLHRMMTVITPS